MYEGEVTELTPCETENPMGGYGKTISHVIIGLKTGKGTKQLKVRLRSIIFLSFFNRLSFEILKVLHIWLKTYMVISLHLAITGILHPGLV